MLEHLTALQRRLEALMKDRFHAWGLVVAGNPWLFILVPLTLSAVLSPFYLLSVFSPPDTFRNENIITGSESWREWRRASEFLGRGGERLWVQAMFTAKDKGSLLRQAHLEELIRVKDELLGLGVVVSVGGQNYSYAELCEPHCAETVPISQFLSMRRDNRTLIDYTFPTFQWKLRSYKSSAYIGLNLYGVEKAGDDTLLSAKLLLLNLQATLPTEELREAGHAWMWEAQRFAAHVSASSALLDAHAGSHELVADAAARTGREGTIYFPVVIGILLVFCISNFYRSHRRESKPLEGALAVVSPLLAIGSAFGLLLTIGVPLGIMSANAPFVILAIGMDDAFLMAHSLRGVSRSFSVEDRVATALANIGPSITITSLTNAVSFGVGALTNSELVWSFSLFTSVSVVADYVFQLTFFLGAMVLSARREKACVNLLSCRPTKVAPRTHAPLAPKPSIVLTHFRSGLRSYVQFLISGPGLGVGLAVLGAYVAAAVYGFVHIETALTDERIFLPSSPYRSIVRNYEDLVMASATGDAAIVIVGNPGDLRDPAQLARLKAYVQALETSPGMAGAESTDFFLDEYISYVQYQRENYTDPNFCYYSILPFLQLSSHKRWGPYLDLDEGACAAQSERSYRGDPECLRSEPRCLRRLAFFTAFAAPGDEKALRVSEWRALSGRPEFAGLNASVYSEVSFYGDQLLSLNSIAITTVASALGFMCLVCIIFIPSIPSVVVAVVAMLNINLGVMGGLYYLGSTLNVITIATNLMAVGFSVDFVSHMSYHYFSSGAHHRDERLSRAFSQLDRSKLDRARTSLGTVSGGLSGKGLLPAFGSSPTPSSPSSSEESVRGGGCCDGPDDDIFWRLYTALDAILVPTLQAAVSTILTAAILPVLVGDFMKMEFLKTICLVVCSGAAHGLFFLPVFLARLTCI